MARSPLPSAATVDPGEIERFERMARDWWDPEGQFAPLHHMNPVRLAYIRDRLCRHFGRDAAAARPLDGLDIVDIGCGGGLIAEPLARLGGRVVGIDAGAEAIEAARLHAHRLDLAIDYRRATVEAMAAEGADFDAVLALEVVEHVADVPAFLAGLAALARPGGLVVLSTLSRTPQSFAMAILGAEYLLGWLPRGTHNWRRFLRPSELAAGLRRAGLEVVDASGMVYDPLRRTWRLSAGDLRVNYLVAASRPAGPGRRRGRSPVTTARGSR